jgi:hypothetical protein
VETSCFKISAPRVMNRYDSISVTLALFLLGRREFSEGRSSPVGRPAPRITCANQNLVAVARDPSAKKPIRIPSNAC